MNDKTKKILMALGVVLTAAIMLTLPKAAFRAAP